VTIVDPVGEPVDLVRTGAIWSGRAGQIGVVVIENGR